MRARPLATAAVLALTTAVLAATPAPARPSATAPSGSSRPAAARLAGNTEVPVEGGSARLAVPPALLAALNARGVALAEIDTQGRISPHFSTGDVQLGIRSGAVTNSGGKVGGELRFTRAGIALINIKTDKAVKLTGFVGDLSQGKLSAVIDRGPRIALGTFPRPRTASSVDTEPAALHMNTAITVSAVAAARLNAALGAACFTGGGSLLHVRIDAALDPSVDLGTALNLSHRTRGGNDGRRTDDDAQG